MIGGLLVIMELTKISKSVKGNQIKRVLIERYLKKKVRELDSDNANIENIRIELYKAFEKEMKRAIKKIDVCGISKEEIQSSFMNLMLKRYCINSTFNLGLLSVLGHSGLGIQPSPNQVIRQYLKSLKLIKKNKCVKFLSSMAFILNERVLMSSIIIELLKTTKRCILIEKQNEATSPAIMIPDLTNTHFNRDEKNSLISRVIEYYGCKIDARIYCLNPMGFNSKNIIGIKEPYNVELQGEKRMKALKMTFAYAYKYIKYMVMGNLIEIALLKDYYKYELCCISPLNMKNIIFTQSSKWSHELWPIAYNHKRTLICYGGSLWGFKNKEYGYLDEYCYYQHQKWDIILHWNRKLAEYDKKMIGKNVHTIIIEPIAPQGRITGACEPLQIVNKNYIVVFDSLPYSLLGKVCSNLGERYRTEKNCLAFINGITEEASLVGFDVVIKTKRNIELADQTFYTCESYLTLLREQGLKDNVHITYKNINIDELIKNSLLVISAPFTSTSLYSHLVYRKPAYYYDPSTELFYDDRAGMDLRLIKGRKELKKLFNSEATKVQ